MVQPENLYYGQSCTTGFKKAEALYITGRGNPAFSLVEIVPAYVHLSAPRLTSLRSERPRCAAVSCRFRFQLGGWKETDE